MRKLAATLMLGVTLALSFPSTAHAASEPVGGCPTGFMLMEVMPHDEMEHKHAGLKTDLNGDGWLCMREATSTIHVHMDNVLPLR